MQSIPGRILSGAFVPTLTVFLLLARYAPAQDVDVLLAPDHPMDAALLAEIRGEWALRSTDVVDWQYEQLVLVGEGRYAIFSHEIDLAGGPGRHYGAVRLPTNYGMEPPASRPVLIWLHGGTQGASLLEVEAWVGHVGAIAESFMIAVPSFRGEMLRSSIGGPFWVSDGESSFLDFDVDDTLMFLAGTLAAFRAADPDRVSTFGTSRGGGVSLLSGVRSPQIRRTAQIAAPADMFLPYLDYNARLFLRQRCLTDDTCQFCLESVASAPLPAARQILDLLLCLIGDTVRDFHDGVISFPEARKALLRRSAVRFAEDLVNVHFHHAVGDTNCEFDDPSCCDYLDEACHDFGDRVVFRDQSFSLRDTLKGLGPGGPPFQFFTYGPTEFFGSGHLTASLTGDGTPGGTAGERVYEHLFRAFCETTPNAVGNGAFIDFEGSLSLSQNNFTVTAVGAEPGTTGTFFFSVTPSNTPFGGGTLCLEPMGLCHTPMSTVPPNGTSIELVNVDVALQGGANCTISSAPGLWYVQFAYYNDPATTILSDAMRVQFVP